MYVLCHHNSLVLQCVIGGGGGEGSLVFILAYTPPLIENATFEHGL